MNTAPGAGLRILQPGPQTTVQDLGRKGHQALGVPVCGALDPVAMRLANALVGNAEDAAIIECRLAGPAFEVTGAPLRLALAGAEATITVEAGGTSLAFPAWRGFDAPTGATVRIGPLRGSGCASLAVAGGIAVAPVLGSRATDLKGRFGGHEGRPLAAGDLLPVGTAAADGPCLELPAAPPLAFSGTLRVVLGPQADAFTDEGIAAFLGGPFEVTREADRMGMRLSGPAFSFVRGADIVSDGIATGSIQVPGSGQPIVLLVDHQTIGGYAKVATVISADLPAAGRLLPGASLRFVAVSVAEAEEARRQLEAEIARSIGTLAPVRSPVSLDEAALYASNLISGAVSALEEVHPFD
ncbi:biotin-dependent carboxyltransferase family protein [Ancylobacter sp. 6x-1]|uniref:Biotin-dependent carboxyltransferase family protein n=1 Tax=Ancylobacter crimeensis TaxID=2579147 RepID=A0ABT0DBM6_9HYPH|nr:biotin-dependent carboxyltransferase family protein [Ancylobacter crimeensis]MCK0197304.1 biotin-dependent carboxyltransferase family protein [Ancylobacter crimeensis]